MLGRCVLQPDTLCMSGGDVISGGAEQESMV